MARKAISKKVRFEVFKRDSFKCQYCGASAPDVILEVDHIQPVAKRGKNDIMNLLTACKDCNAGKSDRLLDDSTAVSKQKAQADRLSERRLQLQMMMEWRNGLLELEEKAAQEVVAYWKSSSGIGLSETGVSEVRKLVKKFGAAEIVEVIDIALRQYDDKGRAFSKIHGIAAVRKRTKSDPAYDTITLCIGILKKRGLYIDYEGVNRLVRSCLEQGYTHQQIAKEAYAAPHGTGFVNKLEEMELS